MRKVLSLFLVIVFSSRCFAIDYTQPFCAYDFNRNGFIEQNEYMPCRQQWVCPDPAVACDENGMCVVKYDPVCVAGTHLDTGLDVCTSEVEVKCPSGYTWDRGSDLCLRWPLCAGNATFVEARDRCELFPLLSCPSGYYRQADRCYKSPSCISGGVFVAERNRCEAAVSYSCPSGWSRLSDTCYRSPWCPSGSSFSSYTGYCMRDAVFSCPSGFTYNSARNRCEKTPECAGSGWWDSGLKKCVTYATEQWQCSINGATYSSWASCNANCTGGITQCRYQIDSYHTYRYTRSYWFRYLCTLDWDVNLWCAFHSCSPNSDQFSTTLSCSANSLPSVTYGNCTYYAGSKKRDSGNNTGDWEICRTCTINGTCTGGYTCPSPYQVTRAGNVVTCTANPACPSGSSYDSANGVCYRSVIRECPSGFWYDSRIGKCIKQPDCSPGYYSSSEKKCVMRADHSCPSGYSYDSTRQVCYSSPVCDGGVYDSQKGKCVADLIRECPASFLYDSSNGVCYHSPMCPQGSYDADINRCFAQPQHICPEGAFYSAEYRLCEAIPQCPQGGRYNPETDMCEMDEKCSQKWGCPVRNVQCISISGKDEPGSLNNFTTHGSKSYYTADGEISADGCNGNVFIFNGFPVECLTSGIITGFHNCCSAGCDGRINSYIENETKNFGTLIDGTMAYRAIMAAVELRKLIVAIKTGYTVSIGGKVYHAGKEGMPPVEWDAVNPVSKPTSEIKDKLEGAIMNFVNNMQQDPFKVIKDTFLNVGVKGYLASLAAGFATDLAFRVFFGGCSAEDSLAVCYRDHGMCHYVGSYCKVSWPLVGCVQRAKVYCCFNSKLARIVHEQGRPQLKTFGGWGDPEDSPNCRGFTPHEFQMLDFSRIDLSEWYADLSVRASEEIRQNLNRSVERLQKRLGSGGTR